MPPRNVRIVTIPKLSIITNIMATRRALEISIFVSCGDANFENQRIVGAD